MTPHAVKMQVEQYSLLQDANWHAMMNWVREDYHRITPAQDAQDDHTYRIPPGQDADEANDKED